MDEECKKCNVLKPINEFGLHATNRDGHNGSCKDCVKISDSERKKLYYQKNKEKKITISKNYKKSNKIKIAKYQQTYLKQYRVDNYETLKEKAKIYRKFRMDNEPLFKLKHKISSIIHKSFRNSSFNKSTKTNDILGCSIEQFKLHLESKFEPWMNWENRGLYKFKQLNYGWDIDHIIPLSTAKTEADMIRLNHYTNLQPLCSYTNRYIKKGNVN